MATQQRTPLLRPTPDFAVPSPGSSPTSSPRAPTIRPPLQPQDANVSPQRRRQLSSLMGGIGINLGLVHAKPHQPAQPPPAAQDGPRVHGMVAKLNAMDGIPEEPAGVANGIGSGNGIGGQPHTTNATALQSGRQAAALKRAELARDMAEHEIVKVRKERDEAEAAVRKGKEDMRRLKAELEDVKDRERKAAKRADVVSNELSRAKESHSSAIAVYEKEIRKSRKEAFKASSTVVKLQAELQTTKAALRTAQVTIESEKKRAARRDEEAFAAEYQLVGLQEALAQAVERLRMVEAERDSLKVAEEAGRTARPAVPDRESGSAENEPSVGDGQAKDGQKEPWELEGPKGSKEEPSTRSPGIELAAFETALFGSPTKATFDFSARTRGQDVKALERQLAEERRRWEMAERKAAVMQLECRLGCCTCRLGEMVGRPVGGLDADVAVVRRMLFGGAAGVRRSPVASRSVSREGGERVRQQREEERPRKQAEESVPSMVGGGPDDDVEMSDGPSPGPDRPDHSLTALSAIRDGPQTEPTPGEGTVEPLARLDAANIPIFRPTEQSGGGGSPPRLVNVAWEREGPVGAAACGDDDGNVNGDCVDYCDGAGDNNVDVDDGYAGHANHDDQRQDAQDVHIADGFLERTPPELAGQGDRLVPRDSVPFRVPSSVSAPLSASFPPDTPPVRTVSRTVTVPMNFNSPQKSHLGGGGSVREREWERSPPPPPHAASCPPGLSVRAGEGEFTVEGERETDSFGHSFGLSFGSGYGYDYGNSFGDGETGAPSMSAMRPDGTIDREAARELIRRRRGRSAARAEGGASGAGAAGAAGAASAGGLLLGPVSGSGRVSACSVRSSGSAASARRGRTGTGLAGGGGNAGGGASGPASRSGRGTPVPRDRSMSRPRR